MEASEIPSQELVVPASAERLQDLRDWENAAGSQWRGQKRKSLPRARRRAKPGEAQFFSAAFHGETGSICDSLDAADNVWESAMLRQRRDRRRQKWTQYRKRDHRKLSQEATSLRRRISQGHAIDVNTASRNSGATALIAASARGRLSACRQLLEDGANLEMRDSGGRTAMMWAAKNGKLKCLQLLLESGAAINAQDDDGMTPLMFAASTGRQECVRLLLENHAAVHRREARYGLNALELARRRKHRQTEKIITNAFRY